MAYSLKFKVINDLPENPNYSSSREEQDFILKGGEFLENLNLSIDEITEICESRNIKLRDYLSQIEPNLHFEDCYLYPKIDGDAAEVYLIDTLTGKNLNIVNFEIINFEKTQNLHKKLEEKGKNIKDLILIPVIDRKGKKGQISFVEIEKGNIFLIDYNEYKKSYVNESQQRGQSGEKFEIIKKLPKEQSNLTVEKMYQDLDF